MDAHNSARFWWTLLGVGIGALVGYYYAKRNFETRMQHDISELQKYYDEQVKKLSAQSSDEAELPEVSAEDTEIVSSIVNQQKYVSPHDYTKHYGNDEPSITLVPSSEVGTDPEYANIPLVYFAPDNVLVYEGETDIIHDPVPLIGIDALTHFNQPLFEGHEPDDDIVYVKNTERKRYYTITRVSSTYREWVRYNTLYGGDDDDEEDDDE